jgi:hypothetical protein
MRISIIILVAVIFASCKTHVFENVVECDKIFNGMTFSKQFDLSQFKIYYSSTHRKDDKLETVIKGDPAIAGDVHLTDVQYLLINDQTSEFIQIAYIPSRYKTGASKYYMDTYLKDYQTKINVYFINQVHYGKIENGKLIYIYKEADFTRSDKYLNIAYTVAGPDLTLTTIETEKVPTLRALNSIVNDEQLKFIRMNNPELIMYGTDDNRSYKVQNCILLTKFDRHKRTSNLLGGIGIGKRNMIMFNLAETKTLPMKNTLCDPDKKSKKVLGIWYGETSARFKFFY